MARNNDSVRRAPYLLYALVPAALVTPVVTVAAQSPRQQLFCTVALGEPIGVAASAERNSKRPAVSIGASAVVIASEDDERDAPCDLDATPAIETNDKGTNIARLAVTNTGQRSVRATVKVRRSPFPGAPGPTRTQQLSLGRIPAGGTVTRTWELPSSASGFDLSFGFGVGPA